MDSSGHAFGKWIELNTKGICSPLAIHELAWKVCKPFSDFYRIVSSLWLLYRKGKTMLDRTEILQQKRYMFSQACFCMMIHKEGSSYRSKWRKLTCVPFFCLQNKLTPSLIFIFFMSPLSPVYGEKLNGNSSHTYQ